MNIKYGNANVLLCDGFEDMKKVYDDDGYDDVPHCFYSLEFVPYVLKQLKENNEQEIKKIFSFVEVLMSSDDGDLVNLAEVSIIESLYFDHVCDTHKATLLKYCGKLTMQSFINCFDDNERAGWEERKAA